MTTFTKHIEMQFERVGSRTKLAGFVGELRDEGGIVLHSQIYTSRDSAQCALDTLTHELLLDYAERGLVDTLPTLNTPPDPLPDDGPGDPIPGDPGYEYPRADDECPKCSLIAIGSRVELLGFGRGTVIKTSDDEHLNVFVKFDSVSRFGSKFWFDRSEVCHHAVTLQSIQIEHTIQTNRICADPDCQGPHYTWQCPSIRELLFAPATLEWAELAALQAA